eukprot:7254267-Prymnesium_polylepis.2
MKGFVTSGRRLGGSSFTATALIRCVVYRSLVWLATSGRARCAKQPRYNTPFPGERRTRSRPNTDRSAKRQERCVVRTANVRERTEQGQMITSVVTV